MPKKRAGIIVRNKTEQQFLDIVKNSHSFLNAKLNLNTSINVERHFAWGNDTEYAGYYSGEENLVNLNFERMYGFPLQDILTVLAHEMRHAYQASKGWIDDPNANRYRGVWRSANGRIESDYWKGKKITRMAYAKCPWEVDARKYEKKYFKMLVDGGQVTPKQYAMSMPGDKHKKLDHTEFERLINKKFKNASLQRFTAYVLNTKERTNKDKRAVKKYTPLFKKYGVTPDGKGNWKSAAMKSEYEKPFNKLWAEYKKECKWEVRKDGEIVVPLTALPVQFRSWSKKALECYWENEDLFADHFIEYPKYDLTFRDLTC